MNPLVTGAVASAYVGAVVGIHRWNVWRLRRTAGLNALGRLDWDALFAGLSETANEAGRTLLSAVATGTPGGEVAERAAGAGFSGGQARWLSLVAGVHERPDAVFEALDRQAISTPAELYLREFLQLTRRTNAFNLEVSALIAKRALADGLARFGDVPALYFARALASSLVGLNRAAIDDLARAVYYSRQRPFYVRAVLDTPYLEEARPALVFQCRQAMGDAR